MCPAPGHESRLPNAVMTTDTVESVSRSAMSNPLQPHALQPDRLLHSLNSPWENAGVGSHSLLQGIFPTQGSNPGCRHILYHLSHPD